MIVILISDWSVDGQMGTMGRKWIWNISCTMFSWSVINIWSNCSTDCGVRTMRVTAALSDQYPAHNIQIFSHRFIPEFCISFKHKLIHLLSQFTVSFLLHCYNVVAFSWSFSQWNKASEIGMRLCTWLVFSPPSPRSLLPLLPHSIFSWWRMCNIVDSRILRG